MKARVIKRFKDKNSGKIHETGEILTLSRERYNEILNVAPLVKEIKQEKSEKTAK